MTGDREPRTERDADRTGTLDELSLFETFPDPLAMGTVADGERQIHRVNAAFERAFGAWDPDADPRRTLPDQLNDEVAVGTSGTLVTATGEDGGDDQTYRVRSVLVDDGASEYLVFTDVTEEIEGRDRLRALHYTTRDMMSADDAEEIATIAARTTENILGFDLNSVRYYRPDPDRLVPKAVSDQVSEMSSTGRPVYHRGETVQWYAFDDNDLLVFQDIRDIDDDVERSGDGSMIVAPLDEYGVLTMGTQEYNAISPTDEQLARVLAANVVAALRLVERRTELREQTEQLARQNERLDRFASVLSHDLRNPLNVASGTLDLVADDVGGETADLVENAVDALERMETLIDQTLTLAREGQAVEEPEPVKVGRVARQAWGTVNAPEATLTVTDDADAFVVDGDAERLRTAFENCFRNAIEHAGPNVAVEVGCLDDGSGIYVADDGPGIAADVADEVFEFGVSTEADGTGFGLAIVAEIVQAHGWTIEASESEVGGAEFVIRTE